MKRRERRPKSRPVQLSAEGAIAKSRTGIAGFDACAEGGLPTGRTTFVFGGPGSGKTVFALQFLVNGATDYGERGIFVALEEDSKQVRRNAASFGWGIERLEGKDLVFIDARLDHDVVRTGAFDLTALLAGVSAMVKKHKARRIVFDGLDMLLGPLDDPLLERNEIHRLHRWLSAHELTGVVTTRLTGADPFAHPKHSFIAFLADCALVLERSHGAVASERSLSIVKYRGSSFAENKAPFVIGRTGIEVAEQMVDADALPATKERVSSGVVELDAMLGGGYYRGASVLLTGQPGTAKSTLAGAFVDAACRRRERTVSIGFDERAPDAIRNLRSVNISLDKHAESGVLRMVGAVSTVDSTEIHLLRIRTLVREQQARVVVIDPVSAFANASDTAAATGALGRFVHWAKAQGITLVCTSLLGAPHSESSAETLGISTIADVWIHLAYAQSRGARARSLTILKARGARHASSAAELVLSERGLSLGELEPGVARGPRTVGKRA